MYNNNSKRSARNIYLNNNSNQRNSSSNNNYTDMNRRLNSNTTNVEYDDDDEQGRLFYKTSVILNLINMGIFGIGLVLFVIGLLYLSIYRYEFSFTTFSIDMMAGLFLTIGILMAFFSGVAVFAVKPYEKPYAVIFYAAFVFLVCLLLFILGVVGLSMNGSGEFSSQIRNSMLLTASRYDQANPHFHQSRKINWVQQKFKCCGVDSYADWKNMAHYRGSSGGNMNIRYVDKYQFENKYPYVDDVPESCCIVASTNCGKQINAVGRDRNSVIYSNGCQQPYLDHFTNDLTFVCALSITISITLLIISLVLVCSFSLIKRNYQILIRSTNAAY